MVPRRIGLLFRPFVPTSSRPCLFRNPFSQSRDAVLRVFDGRVEFGTLHRTGRRLWHLPSRSFSSSGSVDEDIKEKLRSLIKSERVLVLLKGSPADPQCKFSAKMIEILNRYAVSDYAYIDILSHKSLNHCAKEVTNWPTFPQLFVNGELIGGCDIVTELHTSGKLTALLGDVRQPS